MTRVSAITSVAALCAAGTLFFAALPKSPAPQVFTFDVRTTSVDSAVEWYRSTDLRNWQLVERRTADWSGHNLFHVTNLQPAEFFTAQISFW